jgi:excinuclease UvrABC nuclease subunit
MQWKEWQSLPFKERHKLPSISGIYAVVDCHDNVWYVGQAVNLNLRWIGRGHHRYTQLGRSNGRRQYKIYWLPCSPEQLNQMERYYIDLFQPSMNGTRVKQYSLGKPQLKIETNQNLSNVEYIYFRGNPQCYEEISEYVGVFPCVSNNEQNVAVEQQVVKQGHALVIAIKYKVDEKEKITKILCSLHKLGKALRELGGCPYRGGRIVEVWIPRQVRYI